MKPLRIFYLVNALEQDAPTTLTLDIARGAIASGHDVRFIAWSRGGELETTLVKEAIQARTVRGSVLQLQKMLREFRPHLVHTILAKPTIIGAPIAKRAGVPFVVAGHHGSHEWAEKGAVASLLTPKLFQIAARSVDRFACVSNAAADELRQIRVPGEKLVTIPNGIDTERFKPAGSEADISVRQQLFPSDDARSIRIVGSLGNLRQVKGFPVLVAIATHIAKDFPDARFVIWGEGPERARIEKELTIVRRGHGGSPLSEVFKLPGKCADPVQCLNACDLYVQPSIRESFGLATAEAMACGLPVVVSNAGGLPELVGDAGIVCKGGSEMLPAIKSLLCDDEQRRQLGEKARNRIAEKFMQQQMVQSYLQLYGSFSNGVPN